MQLLGKYGVTLITTEQILAKILAAEKFTGTIELEANLAQIKAKTIEGAKIIINQIDAGLVSKAKAWQKNINETSLDEIACEAEQILQRSQPAKLIMYGCTIVLAGPPNTGKSTLLNYLAGKPKAIVTDIKGTTRDWVSARCQIGLLSAEVIDTAGLDERLAVLPKNTIEEQAQEKSLQMLRAADLVLLVLDSSQTIDQFDNQLLEKIAGKRMLTVLNKSDLPARLDTKKLPQVLAEKMEISAKFGTGVENLLKKIQQVCSVKGFDLKSTVCFTSRQENLIKQLSNAKSKDEAVSYITELLKGQLSV
jgi:small GTP-binding protein